jgi:hypothetical protein
MGSEDRGSGNLLKDLRKRGGLSQVEMARRVGWRQPKVSKDESGELGDLTLGELGGYVAASSGAIGVEFVGHGMRMFFVEETRAKDSGSGGPWAAGELLGAAVLKQGFGQGRSLTSTSVQELPFREEIARLESELAGSATARDRLESRLQAAQAQNDTLCSEITTLKSQLAKEQNFSRLLKEAISSWRTQNLELRRELTESRRIYLPQEALSSTLKQLKTEFLAAWKLLDGNRRETLRYNLLSEEQRNARAGTTHSGKIPPPLPTPLALTLPD